MVIDIITFFPKVIDYYLLLIINTIFVWILHCFKHTYVLFVLNNEQNVFFSCLNLKRVVY